MPAQTMKMVYNNSGNEGFCLFAKSQRGDTGYILRMSYHQNMPQCLRYAHGWQIDNWNNLVTGYTGTFIDKNGRTFTVTNGVVVSVS